MLQTSEVSLATDCLGVESGGASPNFRSMTTYNDTQSDGFRIALPPIPPAKISPEMLQRIASVLFSLVAAVAYADDGKQPAAANEKLATEAPTADDALRARGEQIYKSMCANCHGESGRGVADAYADPLVGDDSVGQLSKVISDTMPEGEPEKCVGADAEAVAAYVHHAFYSEAAQIRNRPPRVTLARLTADQLRQSIADLYSRFEGLPNPSEGRGIRAVYFDGDRWKNENKKIERVDPVLDFDFGHEGPGAGIGKESFYIYWEGGVKADVTGRYEIVVRSTCSFVFEFGKIGREFIDNHVQSGEKTEFRKVVTLTAGRVYPFKIDFIQRKRKTELPPARFTLAWVPPAGIEEVIPTRNLVTDRPPATFSLQTVLPADDRSYGFERGIAINRQWDESTTSAALEFAQVAVDELWPKYRRDHKKDPNENREVLRAFLNRIAEAAFRAPLSDEQRATYVDNQINATQDDAEAIKRSVLATLKSPWFLYPTANTQLSKSERTANRLALVMFDSLPTDDRLIKAARADKFETADQIRNYAREKVTDYRVQAKTREFLYEWLNLTQFNEITKSGEAFPGFDAALVCDLRASLNAFFDDVVWSKESDYRNFFRSDFAYTTERIAAFYGDAWKPDEVAGKPDGASESSSEASPTKTIEAKPVANALHRTTASDKNRFGLLTHPFLMSALAYHDSTSPIHRGVFLIRFMLGRTLRPPAEAFSPLSPDLHPDLTTRERVQLQTSPDSCQVCHSKINGLGFTLENFDAVGRYREMERNKPIDANGNYDPRMGGKITFAGPDELAEYLISSEDSQRAFVSRAFQHFVKQPVAAYGPDTMERLLAGFRESNFNVQQLLVEIAVVASLE